MPKVNHILARNVIFAGTRSLLTTASTQDAMKLNILIQLISIPILLNTIKYY